MDQSTVLVCGLSILLLCGFFGAKFLNVWSGNSSGLPFPPGPTPRFLTGNLNDIPSKQSWLTYTEWKRRYGS